MFSHLVFPFCPTLTGLGSTADSNTTLVSETPEAETTTLPLRTLCPVLDEDVEVRVKICYEPFDI